jgi:hypothetical protein
MSARNAGWPSSRLGWVAASLAIITGCASLGVRTDYDREVAFGAFRSYAWIDLITAFVIGPTPEERRWRYWPAAPCGSVVSISIGIGYPYGYGSRHHQWPWRSPYFHYPWGYACSYRIGFGYLWIPIYEEPGNRVAGTLVIDILDAQSRDLIWRGSAEGAVLTYAGESVSQEQLDEVATRILREFPPGRR